MRWAPAYNGSNSDGERPPPTGTDAARYLWLGCHTKKADGVAGTAPLRASEGQHLAGAPRHGRRWAPRRPTAMSPRSPTGTGSGGTLFNGRPGKTRGCSRTKVAAR